MPLSPTDEIVGPAARAGVGVGAFNVVQLEHAEAIVAGAEAAGRPVILQISENTARYHGGLEPVGLAALAVARAALVPVAVHLDHAESVDLVHEAVRLGFSSVMFDASTLPYKENLRETRRSPRTATPGTYGWRRSWARWAEGRGARARCGRIRRRHGTSSPPPGSTRWPWRWAARTP